jgi:hypothetical protein
LIEDGPRVVRPSDFYSEAVLPALAERLDQAFPEFGWRRDSRGWVATNEEHTHSRLGVRAERVVAHGPAPRGFLVHGGEPVLWTAYVNDGTIPRGADFLRVVRDIAERVGVDASALAVSTPRDRPSALLRDFFDLCRREFALDRGATARAYLESRGFPHDSIHESGLGVIPPSAETHRVLKQAGYRQDEIAAAGVVADARWPGRLCGAWRDTDGKIGTLWARAVDDADVSEARYLYLRGASRAKLPPYGLLDALIQSPGARREIVLVEGLLDVHQLRARGIENAAALGGTSMATSVFERLHRLGVEAVTLCFDNDDAGRAATTRIVENAVRARSSPDLYVVDPARLGAAKDPDEFVRRLGASMWRELLEGRTCGIVWRACDLAAARRDDPASVRRIALARAGGWLGALPPRLAVEQEDAVRAVADTCGYSAPAVERAFRARFWREQPRRDLAELSR